MLLSRLDDPVWDGTTPYKSWSLIERTETWADAYSSTARADRYVKRMEQERDVVFFVNANCDTTNPQEKKNKYRPMLLCLRQAEFMLFMQRMKREDTDWACFKTRKVGVSWMVMQDQAYDYLFTPGYSSIVGSYDKDMVDPAGKTDGKSAMTGLATGNMNALFPKFDYTINLLPSLVKPVGYNDASPWKVDFLRQNLVNGAQMYGQAVTGNFGAGARGGEAVVDEASRCQWCKTGWESAGQTATCRGAVLTPYGKNFGWGLCFPDDYAQMMGLDQVERPETFRMIWKDIPWINKFHLFPFPVPKFTRKEQYSQWWEENKNAAVLSGNGYSPFDEIGGPKDGLGIPFDCGYDDGRGNITHLEERQPIQAPPYEAIPEGVLYPWRILEGLRYDSVGAARELDCTFEESKSGRVYSVQLANVSRLPEIPRIREYPLYVFCDPGGGRDNAFYMGWLQWHVQRRRYQTLLEIMYEGKDGRFFLPYLTGLEEHRELLLQQNASERDLRLFEVLKHPMWRPNLVIGDPAGMGAKVASARNTLAQEWRQHKVPVYYNYEHRGFTTRITALRRMLGYLELGVKNTPLLNVSLGMIAFPEKKDDSQSVSETEGWVHHKIYSHPVSALEYFAAHDPHQFDTHEYDVDNPAARLDLVQEINRSLPRDSDTEKTVRRLAFANSRGGRYSRRRAGA